MRKTCFPGLKPFIVSIITLLSNSVSYSQITPGAIDLGKDTISKTNAIGARNTFLNNLRGHGNKATERIKLPVNKLKTIMDACAAKNITDVSVMIITLGPNDLVQARKQNPGLTDQELRGAQMLVFRVPRNAFPGAAGAKINVPKNSPLMISLLGAGLVLMEESYTDLPFGSDDLFFSLGTICPPPTSCDTEF
jgi:hypothetical protein